MWDAQSCCEPRGDHSSSANPAAKISLDYPQEGSILPSEITPLTFPWRDSEPGAKPWAVQVTFADRTDALRVEVPGEPMRVGELDPEAGPMNELLELTRSRSEHARGSQTAISGRRLNIPFLPETVKRDANQPIGPYALATALSLSDREHEAAEE